MNYLYVIWWLGYGGSARTVSQTVCACDWIKWMNLWMWNCINDFEIGWIQNCLVCIGLDGKEAVISCDIIYMPPIWFPYGFSAHRLNILKWFSVLIFNRKMKIHSVQILTELMGIGSNFTCQWKYVRKRFYTMAYEHTDMHTYTPMQPHYI